MVARNGNNETNLPIRVSVLEHGVQELKAGLDSHRGETRAAFNSLQLSLDRLGEDVSSRAQPTNWYGIMSAGAAAVMIVAAIFGLAEWRVNNAMTPLLTIVSDDRALQRQHSEDLAKVQTEIARRSIPTEQVANIVKSLPGELQELRIAQARIQDLTQELRRRSVLSEEDVANLRMLQARTEAERERIKVEQDARIRVRVENEAHAPPRAARGDEDVQPTPPPPRRNMGKE